MTEETKTPEAPPAEPNNNPPPQPQIAAPVNPEGKNLYYADIQNKRLLNLSNADKIVQSGKKVKIHHGPTFDEISFEADAEAFWFFGIIGTHLYKSHSVIMIDKTPQVQGNMANGTEPHIKTRPSEPPPTSIPTEVPVEEAKPAPELKILK